MSNSINKYSKVIADINLNNLDFNLENIRKQVAPSEVIAVVKANAYGHGVVEISKRLEQNNIKTFAVARIKEALEIENAGIKGQIIIFGRMNTDDLEIAIQKQFRITVMNLDDLKLINDITIRLNIQAFVHLNIDTGMGRVGIFPNNIDELINIIKISNNINFEGLYSHFSTSDIVDKTYAKIQLDRFKSVLIKFEQADIKFQMVHMANSGAILDLPETHRNMFNAVRTGIILYGCYPSEETSESVEIKPVMTLKTIVAEVREMDANQPVSYGLRYYTKEREKIAVLPIGYADGISRIFTNKGKVLINDNLYPMVGTVTMDQIMVTVDETVKEGDEVIFWGNFDKARTSDVAERVGTISYELCSCITTRVLKNYIK